MRFLTIQRPGYTEPAVILNGQPITIRAAGFEDMLSVISGGSETFDRVRRWADGAPPSADLDLTETPAVAPLRPRKIICIGLNYRDHAEESKMAIPEVPTVFAKFPTAVIGPNQPIIIPRVTERPDYEAEFAVVIGRGGRHIPESDWREHVFGYTIINDVSARDVQFATTQWMMGKTFDTFAPLGPHIVTADEIEDPHTLDISMVLSGDTMQHSNTKNLIFGVPKLIAYLSSIFTLEPGDVIATGTPGGVGFARTPPRYLKPGDECRVRIAGIGELVNPVIAE